METEPFNAVRSSLDATPSQSPVDDTSSSGVFAAVKSALAMAFGDPAQIEVRRSRPSSRRPCHGRGWRIAELCPPLDATPCPINHSPARPAKTAGVREAAWPSLTPLRNAPGWTRRRVPCSRRARTSAASSGAVSAAIPRGRPTSICARRWIQRPSSQKPANSRASSMRRRDGCGARASAPATSSRCSQPIAPQAPYSIGRRCPRLRSSR
jgi:hypothetical protein